jgi:hypothetical protein
LLLLPCVLYYWLQGPLSPRRLTPPMSPTVLRPLLFESASPRRSRLLLLPLMPPSLLPALLPWTVEWTLATAPLEGTKTRKRALPTPHSLRRSLLMLAPLLLPFLLPTLAFPTPDAALQPPPWPSVLLATTDPMHLRSAPLPYALLNFWLLWQMSMLSTTVPRRVPPQPTSSTSAPAARAKAPGPTLLLSASFP